MSASRLNVILLWHMHQPDYRVRVGGPFTQPWTYLHALKDYSDMAEHLERIHGARAVINFTPVLIDQLDAYKASLSTGHTIDPVLRSLVAQDPPDRRTQFLLASLPSHHWIHQVSPYSRLSEGVQSNARSAVDPTLTTLFHLNWLSEHDRRRLAPNLTGLDRKELTRIRAFVADRIEAHLDVTRRYRALQQRGVIEVSNTPYAHVLMPLLLDVRTAREAQPTIDLPNVSIANGRARARWHFENANTVMQRAFGRTSAGCWPAEGAVCRRTIELFAQTGSQWLASGQQVLRNSDPTLALHEQHRPYRIDALRPAIFFRNDELSDLIGFEYSRWHADQAIRDLLARLSVIADSAPQNDAVVMIALDGENAWEHYPYNGYYFLDGLYRSLAEHPRFELTTCSDYLAKCIAPLPSLKNLCAGSWVKGDFSTWIGDTHKNRAWEWLAAAEAAFESERVNLSKRRVDAAERQLALCEASDHFWWFGADAAEPGRSRFDELFRLQLGAVYDLIKQEAPADLEVPLHNAQPAASETNDEPKTMRRSK